MLRAVPFTATSQAYRATRFGGTAKSNVEGIAKAFQPHYESEMAHMTTQDLAHKVEHLEESLADKKQVATLKQYQAIEATLKDEGVPALIRPAVVARQMLETLKKDNSLRPAYVDIAFHGRDELGQAIEAQFQAGDPIGDLMKDYNTLARQYNSLGGDLVEAEQRNAVLQAKDALLKHFEENSSDMGWHSRALKELQQSRTEEDTEASIYYKLLQEYENKLKVDRNMNQGSAALIPLLKEGEEVEDTPLQKIYKNIIQQNCSSSEFESIKEKYDTHTDHTNCNHSYNDIDFSGKPTAGASHAHSCDDPTHNHAPTPNAEAHDHAHDGEGGDFFHLAMARYEMQEAIKKNPALTQDFEQARIGGMKTVQNLAEHLQKQPALLAEGSTLEQNFRVVSNALKATQQLHDKGHVAPDTAENIKDVLIQNKWDAKDAKAFNDALAMYTSKADHLNGHNPQVVKAWAIMAGAGGAVCANGCCAGSIFCFNEAVALVGSLYSSITNSLHLGHHQDDENKNKTAPVDK
jgi:hypothetical protein